MKRVLITGSNGFIGRPLCTTLAEGKVEVRAAVRDEMGLKRLSVGIKGVITGGLDANINWEPFLEGVDAVVHLAARVHQMKACEGDAEEAYQQINVEATRSLALAADRAGVKRFVFLSSVKAMGEETLPGGAWDESSPCFPQDAYGRSKYDAEKILIEISQKTGLEVVILRLPLVYGPGVKANMARLFRIVDRGIPLPLGMVKNARSLLFIGNLVDAIGVVLEHHDAVNQTFLISDGEDCSTTELVRRVAQALDRPARMFPILPVLLRLGGKLTGKSGTLDRLLNSLVIDCAKIRRDLDWTPPFSMDQGLKLTAEWFKKQL